MPPGQIMGASSGWEKLVAYRSTAPRFCGRPDAALRMPASMPVIGADVDGLAVLALQAWITVI